MKALQPAIQGPVLNPPLTAAQWGVSAFTGMNRGAPSVLSLGEAPVLLGLEGPWFTAGTEGVPSAAQRRPGGPRGHRAARRSEPYGHRAVA